MNRPLIADESIQDIYGIRYDHFGSLCLDLWLSLAQNARKIARLCH